MANPNESTATQDIPDMPERAKAMELSRAESERKARERDLASMDAMLDANPSKTTLELVLRRIVEKMPEERATLELMSVGADIQVLEFLAKSSPSDTEASALLERRKKRRDELSRAAAGAPGTESRAPTAERHAAVTAGGNAPAKEKPAAHDKPNGTAERPEYPPGTKVLSVEEMRKLEQTGKALLERKPGDIRESSPERELLETKIGQANLLLSAWEAYRDYLASIEANIRFKNVSDKPKRYQDQVRAIDSALSELGSVASLPESARAEALKRLDVKALADRVFVPETKLSTLWSGLMNQPMLEVDAETGEKRFLPNIASTLAETEGRYARMRAIVAEGNDFGPASAYAKKYEILGLLRSNDSRDDDGLRLNSGEAIAKQAEGDVLGNAKLRENDSIRRAFDIAISMEKNPKAAAAVRSLAFGNSMPNAQSFGLLFQSYGVDFPKGVLSALGKKAAEYRSARKDMVESRKDELSKLVDRPGTFPEGFVREFKKDPVKTVTEAFENDAARKILSLSKHEIIAQALKSDAARVRELRKDDPALALYTNIEGITHTPDSTVNGRVDTSQFYLEQLLMFYVSWTIGNAIARAPILEKPVEYFAKGAKLKTEALVWAGRTANLAGKSAELVGTTVTEWVPFALFYQTLNGLANQGYVHADTLGTAIEVFSASHNVKDDSRIIAFLAVIKLMLPVVSKLPNPQAAVEGMLAREFPELALKIAGNPAASRGLELSRTAVQTGQNVILDTAALVWADTVIRGLYGEDLPKDSGEIPNYLTQEFKVVIGYVIWLRTLTDKLSHGPKPASMSDIAKRQIEVNYQENGDIAIRMAEGRVFVIRRELRNLGQAHDRLKNGGTDKLDSRAIAAGKREKKTELRGAMSDVEFVRRELATHESGIAASQPNGTRPGEGVYADAAAGVGAPKGYVQRALPDENFTRTGTNHTANNLKSLEIDPKSIKLSDTLSGFSPSLDAEAIGGTFRSLRKGMGNVESPELLRKQAETAIRQELQTKYDAMMKEYDKLTPEAQRAMEAWRESMERQAKELAEDFQNALGTKLERGKMDGKWGNPEYMDRIMGTFAEKAPESLKSALLQKIPGVRRKENLVSE